MSKEKHDIDFEGDKWASVEVYVPARSKGVLNVVVEDTKDKVRLYHLHFDVAETLRDELTKALEQILEQ